MAKQKLNTLLWVFLSKHKSIIILVSAALFLSSAYFYAGRINIIAPISIKVDNNISGQISSKCTLVSITGLGRQITVPFNTSTSSFEIHSGYYSSIELHVSDSINPEIFTIVTPDNECVQQLQLVTADHGFSIVQIEKTIFVAKILNILKQIIIQYFIFIIVAGFLIWGLIYFARAQCKASNAPSHVLAVLYIFIGYAVFFLAASYTYPNAEDIMNMVFGQTYRTDGFLSKIFMYFTLDTRYTTNFLYANDPAVFGGVEWYKLTPMLLLVFITLAVAFFAFRFFGNQIPKKIVVFGSMFFVLLHFAYVPSIAYDLYYSASSLGYLASWVFVFTWIALFLLWIRSTRYAKKVIYGFMFMITFILSFGTNEMNFVINAVFTVLIFYYILKYNRQCYHELIILLLLFVAVTVFVVSLPGFAIRTHNAGMNQGFGHILQSLQVSFNQLAPVMLFWIIEPVHIACMLIVCIFMYRRRDKLRLVFSTKEIIICALFLFLSIFVCYAFFLYTSVTTYSNDVIANSRAIGFLNWLYQLLAFVLIPLIISRILPAKIGFFEKHHQHLIFALTLGILIAAYYGQSNFQRIVEEYKSGEYSEFKTRMQLRYSKIYTVQNSGSWKLVVTDEINEIPSTIRTVPDLGYEPHKPTGNVDYSVAYEVYFGIDEIRLNSDTTNIITRMMQHE